MAPDRATERPGRPGRRRPWRWMTPGTGCICTVMALSAGPAAGFIPRSPPQDLHRVTCARNCELGWGGPAQVELKCAREDKPAHRRGRGLCAATIGAPVSLISERDVEEATEDAGTEGAAPAAEGDGFAGASKGSRLYQLFTTLLAAKNNKNEQQLQQVIESIMEQEQEVLTPKHCTILVSAVGALGLAKQSVVLLERFKEKGLQPNKVTYGAVVNVCVTAQDMQGARRVMQDMRASGNMPDALEYSFLLHGFRRMNRTDDCLACFDEMLFNGVKPNTRAYDGVLGALASSERWSAFEMYRNRMEGEGVAFSPATYWWSIKAADRARDWKRVCKLYRRMCRDGFTPTATATHTALRAALSIEDIDTAVQAMMLLLKEGWNFGRTVYQTLQLRLLLAGRLDDLRSLMSEARTRRGTNFAYHDTNSCNLILTECCKQRRRLDLAYTFLQLMHDLDLKADDVSYNILMDIELKLQRAQRVRELLDEMQARGIRPGVVTYNILLSACTGDTQDRNAAQALWADFKASGLTPDRILYLSLMRALPAEAVDRSVVYGLLDEAAAGGIPLDTQMANYALRLLAGAKDVAGVEGILERMRAGGVERDVVSWTTAIKAFAEARDWERALAWLVQMEEEGVPPNEVTYATAMHVVAQAGQWREALKLLERMEAKGLRNVVALTTAMAACEAGKAYREGLALWERMQVQGLNATIVTVDLALRLCEKVGDSSAAVAVLQRAIDWSLLGRKIHVTKVLRFVEVSSGRQAMVMVADWLLEPERIERLSNEGRVVVVEALCEVGLLKHAWKLLTVTEATLDRDTWRRLMGLVMLVAATVGRHDMVLELYDGLSEKGAWMASGRDVYQAMLMSLRAMNATSSAKGQKLAASMLAACRADVREGNEVLAACVTAKEWDLATSALIEAGRQRLRFDEQTYQHAIAILAERREGPRAVQMLREMASRGFAPRTAEYTHAMQACLDKHWDMALELFKEVERGEAGVHIDTGVIMAALGACKAGRDWQMAGTLLGISRNHDIEPTVVVYNALLGVYAVTQRTEKVLETLEDMRFRGVKPDEFTYNTAIGAFAKVGDYRQAGRWLSVMSWEGVPATTVTYNCAIDACANGNNPARAAELFQEMKDRKVAVDKVTYGSLINAFAKMGQWESALKVLDEMRSSSLRPNNFVYCSAMSACTRGSEWALTLSLFDRMLTEDGLTPDQYTINEALHACARGLQWEKALEVLSWARQAGVTLDVISYNKALQACIGCKRWSEAQDLVRQMAADKVAPDRTTHSLVEEISVGTWSGYAATDGAEKPLGDGSETPAAGQQMRQDIVQ